MDITELKQKAEAVDGQFPLTVWETEDGDRYECPLCNGDGEVDGDISYSKGASGIQAFGIGKDLNDMKAYVDAFTPSTVLSLIAEVESLKADLHNYMNIANTEANLATELKADNASLRKQLEEAEQRHSTLEVEHWASNRMISALRSSIDAQAERAVRWTLDEYERQSNATLDLLGREAVIAAVLSQLKEQKNG
jgi:hypothetical protein